MLTVTAIYACILTFLMIGLSNMVSAARGRTGTSLLAGDDRELAVRMRRHGNFVESVPMALLLLGIAEILGAPALWLHAVGGLLVLARVLHPLGLRYDRLMHPLRLAGGIGTQIAMVAAVGAIVFAKVS